MTYFFEIDERALAEEIGLDRRAQALAPRMAASAAFMVHGIVDQIMSGFDPDTGREVEKSTEWAETSGAAGRLAGPHVRALYRRAADVAERIGYSIRSAWEAYRASLPADEADAVERWSRWPRPADTEIFRVVGHTLAEDVAGPKAPLERWAE